MGKRGRKKARDLKYVRFQEFENEGIRSKPFLKPAIDKAMADLTPEQRALLDHAVRQEP